MSILKTILIPTLIADTSHNLTVQITHMGFATIKYSLIEINTIVLHTMLALYMAYQKKSSLPSFFADDSSKLVVKLNQVNM